MSPRGASKTMFLFILSRLPDEQAQEGHCHTNKEGKFQVSLLPILQLDITVPGPVILVSPACLCLCCWVVAAPRCPSP